MKLLEQMRRSGQRYSAESNCRGFECTKDRQGRILLNEYHQIPDHEEVFVVGDCASLPFSPSAQAAQAQGKQIAEAMQAIWKGETPRLGKIKLRGTLGSLGKKSGFGIMGKRTLMTGKLLVCSKAACFGNRNATSGKYLVIH